MTHYITITKTDYKGLKIIIAILILINIILCFKGMALMQRYNEVVKEKETLEEIIEVQKGMLEEI